MKKLLIALPVALSLLLASCSESNIEKAQQVVALVKENCGVAVSVASVAAAFAVPNPVVTGIAAMATAICEQVQGSSKSKSSAMEEWEKLLFRVQDDGTPPLPQPKPEPAPAPLPVPLPEPAPGDDCVAVINGVCIKEEGK